MKSNEIRRIFLDFFKEKSHEIVPSAPMVIKDDPTLMFTNAGMNQFKDIFLGNTSPKFTRAADTQKCLRVSGKHNDLEEVGHDTYHHTMFEMLGNWSFGDYFKKEAITWAWELLVDVYKMDPDRLYVTVFEGDDKDGLPLDEEAKSIWKKYVPAERILNGNKKDNFWEMGDTGPCGPCSEIHVDIRPDEERAKVDGASLVNQDHPEVIEIWNLVFMEFNRMANGKLVRLPARHVDTGMGFERLCMVLQGVRSNYDTDVFQPLIQTISKKANLQYGDDREVDIAMRVISDHVRAVSFAIADGQLPSNSGAGYVIRRILRRAIRYAFTYLELKEPFIHELVGVLAQQLGEFFPELKKQVGLVEKVIAEEEASFLRTLDQGLRKLDELLEASDKKQLSGENAFLLYDTFGFPVDLTNLIAHERGYGVDLAGFETELEKQKSRSRAATASESGDWVELRTDDREEFIGYDHTQAKVKITRYREVKTAKKSYFQLIFNLTPFYAEGGGQVGDTGYIESNGAKYTITNTKRENNVIVHFTDTLPNNPEDEFDAHVDADRRKRTALNHSATHLLHQALREVLGTHVEQKGSLVHPDYLRFDFSHFAKVTQEELEHIEKLVNRRVRENFALEEKRAVPMAEAQEMGAMALFGEKYGDLVRVIKFGESVELCGGIHVGATGEIGPFVITSEGAVAAGIRRVEALTGEAAENYLRKQVAVLDEVKAILKSPKDPIKSIAQLQDEVTQMKKALEAAEREKAKGVKRELIEKIEEINGVKCILQKVDLDGGAMKDLIFQLRAEQSPIVIALASVSGPKVVLSIGCSDELVKEKGYHAGNWIRELSSAIGGGGGGQPFFATAGGKNPDGIEKVFAELRGKI